VSLAQAAAITGLSIRTLRRAIDAGRLRAFRVGRILRLRVDNLEGWIESDDNVAGEAPAPSKPPDGTAFRR